jgi:hypothetical protein
VNHGADLLVNITNDAWFGRSGAPGQHLQMAVFRAVEERVGLARAANTGISALIQPTGEITARTGLFMMTQITGPVAPKLFRTFYARHGDVFACLRGARRGGARRRGAAGLGASARVPPRVARGPFRVHHPISTAAGGPPREECMNKELKAAVVPLKERIDALRGHL